MQTQRIGSRTVAGAMWVVCTMASAGFAVDVLDDPVQIDDRAQQVLVTSNSLCWEMNRYHQRQPDYRETYRMAKEIWTRAGELRDALHSGPVETEILAQRLAEMNQVLTQLEKRLAAWGDGDRSLVPLNEGRGPRTVVTPGVEVNIPFVGVRVGGPRTVVTENGGGLQLERRRLHPNSHGSKRCLEREFAALKVAVGYLVEDAGITVAPGSEAPPSALPGATPPASPTPQPPNEDPKLGEPQKVTPRPTIGGR